MLSADSESAGVHALSGRIGRDRRGACAHLDNGRTATVKVNDRGPFTGDRLIDLSRGAANVLGFAEAAGRRPAARIIQGRRCADSPVLGSAWE